MATPSPSKRAKLGDESDDTAHTLADRQPIQIDPHGNLTLVVGPGAVRMQVNANALRRASKVFDCWLFGFPLQPPQAIGWTLQLSKNDANLLEQILHAVHANFDKVPRHMTHSRLYAITMEADRFSMTGSLRPWATTWIWESKTPYYEPDDEEGTGSQDLERLYVLRHLDKLERFASLLTTLVVKSMVGRKGVLLFKDNHGPTEDTTAPVFKKWDEFPCMPESIVDYAKDRRRDLISRLLDGLDTSVTAYTHSYHEELKIGCVCPSTALGLIIQCLTQKNLWPLPKVGAVRLSVAQLSGIVGQISRQIRLRTRNHEEPPQGQERRKYPCPLRELQVFSFKWRDRLQSETEDRFRGDFGTENEPSTFGYRCLDDPSSSE